MLICGINFWPDLIGAAKYTGEMAGWLAARGHEVRVVTAPPYYPEWRLGRDYSAGCYKVEQWQCVRVYRCPLWVPVRPTGMRRILHLASFALSSFPVMLRQAFWRPGVVLLVEPPLFCAPAALIVAWLSGGRAWLHIQDFEVDAAIGMGLVPSGLASRLAYAIERALLRRFHKISTISINMLARLNMKRVVRGVLFPNWVDVTAIFPLPGTSPMRRELGIRDDAVVALYSGSIANKQGLEILIEAARMLESNTAVFFVICGNGPSKAQLQTLASGLRNVMFLPLQPAEKLNALLNMADVHLLPQRAEAADLVMPSKLTGMFASGRPIVATAAAGTQIAKLIMGCGLLVQPGDVVGFSAAIAHLAVRVDLRLELGHAARRYAVEHLGRDAVLAEFERELRDRDPRQ